MHIQNLMGSMKLLYPDGLIAMQLFNNIWLVILISDGLIKKYAFYEYKNVAEYDIQQILWPLFTKRKDVLPQDFVSERYDQYNIQSGSLGASRDLAVRRLTT